MKQKQKEKKKSSKSKIVLTPKRKAYPKSTSQHIYKKIKANGKIKQTKPKYKLKAKRAAVNNQQKIKDKKEPNKKYNLKKKNKKSSK